ncbi:MAG TPA: protein kinase [Burkholderiales bacterium]|nr:protein kinase [Burkholderiales bacterium]
MTEPQRLGKYELVEVLGRGAMGVVYKAFDPDIHRTVAIKTIRKELIDDDDHTGMMMARFKNEARAAGRLSHPGIVAVYDYGESSSVTYIAMEFVQGASLREYFNRGTRFPERDIVSIMAQLLDALHHAHEQGVWHRDIKPANLIIMDSGRIKVADFGIARIDTSQLTLTGVVMGSPGYMAPEQYTGGTVDRRADLFAAGVVMYQLLTGTHAFSGTTEQVAYKICHERPAPPSEADPGRGWERYDAVIARALAKQPAERFATADAFLAAILEAFAAPVSPTVSAETIIVEPTVATAMFDSSNPSARTLSGAMPRPLSVRPLEPAGGAPTRPESERRTDEDTVLLDRGQAAGGTVIGHRRKWVIAATAVAVIALAVVAGLLLTRTPGVPSPAKAPAVAKTPASPPAKAEALKTERRPAEQSSSTAAAKPAAKPPPPRTTVVKPEPPPRKAAAPAPTKTAPKEPERKLAAARPAPAAAPAPAPPKPASAPPAQSGGGFWSDQGLTLRVQSKLQFNRSMWGSNSGIVVAVRNGVVTLRGTVRAQQDVAEAGRLAAAVEGVKAVRNELKVGPIQ